MTRRQGIKGWAVGIAAAPMGSFLVNIGLIGCRNISGIYVKISL